MARALSAAVVATIVALAGPACANSVTFNLTGSLSDASSYVFTDVGTGLTLTVLPVYFTDFSPAQLYAGGKVTQTSGGIGVKNGSGDDGQIDGSGYDDGLKLVFSDDVLLASITLTGGSSSKDVYYYVEDTNSDGILSGDVVDGPNPIGADPFTINFAALSIPGADFYGDTFGLGTDDKKSAWRVSQITVSYGDPSVVPLPGALPLFGAGLFGLGLIGRLRRKGEGWSQG